MSSVAEMVWALIVVSSMASVSFSTGYPTQDACEDAKSIAQTGRTVAEVKEDDRKVREARIERQRKWDEAHPVRKATAEDRKRCAPKGSMGNISCVMVSDDEAQDTDPSSYGGFISILPSLSVTIRYARCVMVPKGSDK